MKYILQIMLITSYIFLLSSELKAQGIDLSLSITSDGSHPVTHTIQVRNDGPADATGVEIRDTLPLCLQYQSNTISKGSINDMESSILVWTLGDMEEGEVATLKITSTACALGNCENTAQVTSANEVDIDSAPNNDDGDQSEDDEDNVVETFVANQIVTTTADANAGSLRQAVLDAPDWGIITFDHNQVTGPIQLTSFITITDKSLVFLGIDSSQTIIDGSSGSAPLFFIQDPNKNKEVFFKDMSFINGGGNTPLAGAIFTDASTSIKSCHFYKNKANDAGAILARTGNLYVLNSDFNSNQAISNSGIGGAILAQGPTVIEGSIFTGNEATSSGGAIYSQDFPLRIEHSEFEDNKATKVNDGSGGAVFTFIQTFIQHCTFIGNSSTSRGGAIVSQADIDIYNSVFSSNQTNNFGGALENKSGDATIINSTFYKNQQLSNDPNLAGGGAIFSEQGNLQLQNSIFFENIDKSGKGPDIALDVGTITATHNLISNYNGSGLSPGTNGNISGNPLFKNALGGDLRLMTKSPCVNTADNSMLAIDMYDIDGDGNITEQVDIDIAIKPRVIDALVDMGAYEMFNESCIDAIYLNCGDSHVMDTKNASDEDVPDTFSAPNCTGAAPFSNTVWFSVMGTGETIEITSCNPGLNYGQEIHIYTGNLDPYSGNCTLACVQGTQECSLSIATTSGTEYLIMIAQYGENLIGDVLTVELNCGDCPDRGDLSFSPPQDFYSNDDIHVETNNKIVADNKVATGADIEYDAGMKVTLLQNFKVEKGAMFKAYIDGCD